MNNCILPQCINECILFIADDDDVDDDDDDNDRNNALGDDADVDKRLLAAVIFCRLLFVK